MLNSKSTKEPYWFRLSYIKCRNLTNIFYCYFYFVLLIFTTFFSYAVTSSNNENSMNNFDGSGAFSDQFKNGSQMFNGNPDDEPGDDIEQGSGNSEGSGFSIKADDQSLDNINMSKIPDVTSHNNFDLNNQKTILSKPINNYNDRVITTIVSSTSEINLIMTTSTPLNIVVTKPSLSKLPPLINDEEKSLDSFEMLKSGILAAIIGGALVGVLLTILLVMFVVYRMRKKDEGSYSLDTSHQPPNYCYGYQKTSTKEFYA